MREGTTRVRMVSRHIFQVTEGTVLDYHWADFEKSGAAEDGELSVWDLHVRMSGTDMEPGRSSRGIGENGAVERRETIVELFKFTLVTEGRKDALHAVFKSVRNVDLGKNTIIPSVLHHFKGLRVLRGKMLEQMFKVWETTGHGLVDAVDVSLFGALEGHNHVGLHQTGRKGNLAQAAH